MSEQNKALARRFFLEVCDGRKPAVADEIFAAGHQYIDPASPGIPAGPAGMKQLSTTYYTAFADAYWIVDEQVALDDVVVTRWSAGGTQSAALMGIPATNRAVKVSGISFQRIRAGKIQETRSLWDALGMLQQLGVVPELAAK
jgi:steroid delta-isomerase-like uncharacterized protein